MDRQPALLRDTSAAAPVGVERPAVARRRRRRGGREPLDAARARRCRHGDDCRSAIRVDALHRTAHPGPRHQPGAAAGDVLGADCRADVPVAGPGRAHRALRTARAAVDRDARHGRELDAGVAGVERVGALSHLRPARRHRDRHRLHRGRRPHGAVVSRSPRPGHRLRRRRLRHGGPAVHVSRRRGHPRRRALHDDAAVRSALRAHRLPGGAGLPPSARGSRAAGRAPRPRPVSPPPAATSRPGRCCARRSSGCSS